MKLFRYFIFTLVVAVCFVLTASAAEIGKAAPGFELENAEGQRVSLESFRGKFVVLEWFNSGCPFVEKHYKAKYMQELQQEYTKKGVIWLTINSTYPGHKNYLSTEATQEIRGRWDIQSTHDLLDPEGIAGGLYGAKTTPHMFIVSPEGILMYQGAIDNEPGIVMANPRKATNYVKVALDSLLAGGEVSQSSTKPYGCSVKYSGE